MISSPGTSLVPKENLDRNIGVFGLACTVVNVTIGTGIFVLPGLAAEILGANAIYAFLICGGLIFLIALCFAEVGSNVSVSGGPYMYIESAFGPFAGFLANIIFLLSCLLGDAAAASALTLMLQPYFSIDPVLFRFIFGLLVLGGLAWINVRGSKYGVGFVVITTIAKMLPLLLLIVWGLGNIKFGNLSGQHIPSASSLGEAAILLFYAFFGIETAVNTGGEFRDPSRTVPLGILSGLSFVLIVYVSIQLISQGMLGEQLVNYKDAPLVAVSRMLFGPVGITLMIVGTTVSMLGSLSGEILANPRIMFAGARDGILPRFLFRVHPKFKTPALSVMTYCGIVYLLTVFGAFKQLIILTSASTLLIYLGVVFSAMRYKNKETEQKRKTFRLPGGYIIPGIAALVIIWLLSGLSGQQLAAIGISVLIISIVYFLIRLIRKKPVIL
jgi:basic amino acid/polyamine antiporter, APA family